NVAAEGDGAVAEQPAHHLDRVAQAIDGPGVGKPVLALHLHAMARAEPEHESTVGELIDGGGGHGDGRRAADEHARDAGAETDARGGGRAGGQDGELIAAVAFRHPRALVAEVLGLLHALHDLGGGEPAGEGDADAVHDYPRRSMSRTAAKVSTSPSSSASPMGVDRQPSPVIDISTPCSISRRTIRTRRSLSAAVVRVLR